MTKTEAYEYFGVELKNTRWSWCGVSGGTPGTPEGTKVFSAWGHPTDYFKDRSTGRYVYRARWKDWYHKAGGGEMAPLLEQALASGERVRLVYIEAADWDEEPLRVAYAKPLDKQWFRVTRFDRSSGEFDIEEV